MTAYTIAERKSDSLTSPVFDAGPSGEEEAIAVFTSRSRAQQYISEAGWSSVYEVGEIDELQLLRWMITAHEQGTQYLAIDPDRQRHLAGAPQDILVIDEKLATFAETLKRDVLSSTIENIS